ncbi:MAG: NAD(P)-dependent oxidoreductase [Dehalococcoidia bacterium]
MRIGFVGLGNMGQGMADNLLLKNADLTVYTRTESKIETMINKGAKGTNSLSDLVENVDVVMTCLPDVETSLNVILGKDGIIKNAKKNQVIIDHSTVEVSTSQLCSKELKKINVNFLDAPISGGPMGASSGTLTIMVGGEKNIFDDVQPYLLKMGTNVRFMGNSGAGTGMKLINQLLVGVNTVASAEAFAFANKVGVDIEVASELLDVSWGGSKMVERSAPITKGRNFPNSSAPVRNLNKDLGIINEFANLNNLSLDLTKKSLDMFSELMNDNKSEYDIAGVIEIIEKNSNNL